MTSSERIDVTAVGPSARYEQTTPVPERPGRPVPVLTNRKACMRGIGPRRGLL